MARRTADAGVATDRVAAVDNAGLTRLDTILTRADWFQQIDVRVPPGETTKGLLEIPVADARRLLLDVVRLVADVPKTGRATLVWHQGASELAVDLTKTALRCDSGLITVVVTVTCDQAKEPTQLEVPFAVGTRDAPAGLVMSTFTRLVGPRIVTDLWSEAVTAFSWECILELARRVTERLGTDTAKQALVPGGIGADKGVLLIQPMARFGTR
jgi:hypothetical protein